MYDVPDDGPASIPGSTEQESRSEFLSSSEVAQSAFEYRQYRHRRCSRSISRCGTVVENFRPNLNAWYELVD